MRLPGNHRPRSNLNRSMRKARQPKGPDPADENARPREWLDESTLARLDRIKAPAGLDGDDAEAAQAKLEQLKALPAERREEAARALRSRIQRERQYLAGELTEVEL